MILKRQERGDISDYSLATPLDFLVQGIQLLQQLQLRRDGHEPELPEGSLDLPKLSEPYQDNSAVVFLEWVF